MNIKFRYATEEDKKVFNNMILDSAKERWLLGIHGWEDRVFSNDKTHVCIIAQLDKKIVGYASAAGSEPDGGGFNYIENLFVIPSHRRNGVGKALLEYIEKYAQDNWVAVGVDLWTNENDPMETLIKRSGFKLSGKLKDVHFRKDHFSGQSRWYKLYKKGGDYIERSKPNTKSG